MPRLTVELPEPVYKLVKAAAAKADRSLSQWVREALAVAAREDLDTNSPYEQPEKGSRRRPN